VYLVIFKSEVLFSEVELYSKGEIIIHCIGIIWNTLDEICLFTELVHGFVIIFYMVFSVVVHELKFMIKK
jgi:hypothetical protein